MFYHQNMLKSDLGLADGEIVIPTDESFVSLRNRDNYSLGCRSDSVLDFLYISFLSLFVSLLAITFKWFIFGSLKYDHSLSLVTPVHLSLHVSHPTFKSLRPMSIMAHNDSTLDRILLSIGIITVVECQNGVRIA
ncbi:hypothetical protein L873DRAFT_752985 [Choiromyces venosus 120613-1]|uniref:Uncharacterized protein n=1 Tax=Choiromyces venosus 120613-1 TaxID=1336337 RepID=A0A3N4ISZ5_9PEZI|nr:hypothetical protein L873DRAFT_752985 [Choiromyces venosus 120613-1]